MLRFFLSSVYIQPDVYFVQFWTTAGKRQIRCPILIVQFFACWVILHVLSPVDLSQNQLFKKKSFRNAIKVSGSLDPDQARHFVGPGLGPNRLQRLSAGDTSG